MSLENVGDGTTGEFNLVGEFNYTAEINGVLSSTIRLGNLPAGDSRHLEYIFSFNPGEGYNPGDRVILRAEIDSDGEIDEINEGNNWNEIYIMIPEDIHC